MVCACIDIGSNTTRLLVAEVSSGQVTAVLERRAFTRIGTSLGHGGEIARTKADEVAAVVAEQAAVAAGAGAPAPSVVATAAIRDAPNGEAFCAAITALTGLPVAILTPEAEARMAFLGATRTLGRPLDGVVGVVDVGGGSSEIAIGTLAGGVSWSASFAIGSGGLTDAHLRSDPPDASELRAVTVAAAGAFGAVRVPVPSCAVAVGGSATSLRRLVGTVLDPRTLERAIGVLSGEPCEAVARRFALDPERVRLLPAGILILAAASRCIGRPLQIGRGGAAGGDLHRARSAVGAIAFGAWRRPRTSRSIRSSPTRWRARASCASARGSSSSTPTACWTRRTSSGSTRCGSPHDACGRCSRSSRPASPRTSSGPSCATSSGSPTRWASGATRTCTSRRWSASRRAWPPPSAAGSRPWSSGCASARRRPTRRWPRRSRPSRSPGSPSGSRRSPRPRSPSSPSSPSSPWSRWMQTRTRRCPGPEEAAA